MAIEFIAEKPGLWRYDCGADNRELSITLTRSGTDSGQTWMCEIILDDRSPSMPCANPDECDYGEASFMAGRMVPCDSCSAKDSRPTYRCTWGLPVSRVVSQAKYEVDAINRWERLPFIGDVLAQRWIFKR